MTLTETFTEEQRCKNMTLCVLLGFLEDYIKASTINNRYIGEPHYLMKYQELYKSLTEGQHNKN
jgi:hypothetical protein